MPDIEFSRYKDKKICAKFELYIFIDGNSDDFVLLCIELDCFSNELETGKENRTKYNLHNQLKIFVT